MIAQQIERIESEKESEIRTQICSSPRVAIRASAERNDCDVWVISMIEFEMEDEEIDALNLCMKLSFTFVVLMKESFR